LEKEQEKLRRDWERDELKRAKSAHKEIERKEKEGIKKKKQEIKWVVGSGRHRFCCITKEQC
jgi:hypothetical protein